MFRAKTVIVIGAGASVEVGLPMGSELLEQITKLTHITYDGGRQASGDHVVAAALRHLLEGQEVSKFNEHLHAAWRLSESAKQAISIDNVIDALEDDRIELVGKLGIVRAILEAESRSDNFRTSERNPQALEIDRFRETWYDSLTKLLTESVKVSQIDNIFENLEIISFNYDRCIENYLPFSLASYYGVSVERVQALMASLPIHRPYGVAGRLPWQPGSSTGVPFGRSNSQQLSQIVQQIRTFTERLEEGAELKAMKNAITVAERIIFLGFAFHRQNVALLSQRIRSNAEILATALSISDSDKSVIRSELKGAFGIDGDLADRRIVLADMRCSQFFREYWRTLTAGPGDYPTMELPAAFNRTDPFIDILANRFK